MPPIGDNGRNLIRVKAKPKRKAPARPAPRPQGMSRTFTPKGKPRPAPPGPRPKAPTPGPASVPSPPRPRGQSRTFGPSGKPAPTKKPHTLPKSFKPANTQPDLSRKDRDKATKIARKIGREDQAARVRKARQRFFSDDPIKQVRTSQREAIKAFSELRESDPESYKRKVREADEGPIKKAARIVGGGTQKGIEKAVEGISRSLPAYHTGTDYDTRGKRRAESASVGIGVTPLVKEATEIIGSTPAGIYMTAAAAKEAAEGNPERAKKLWKDFKDTSALSAAVSGNLKEAGKRAQERPLTTALELSGAKALVGRSAGTAARSGVAGKRVKVYASVEREPLRYYKGSKPGQGPAGDRRYSKDLITNRLQKRADRKKRERGEDPNVYKEPRTPDLGGGGKRVVPPVGPGKHPVDDLVDRHVHAKNVMQNQATRQAEKKAKKRGHAAEPLPVDRTPEQVAKEHTARNARVSGLDPKALAHQAHDILGIKKPVLFKELGPKQIAALTEKLGKEPRGWTRPIKDNDTHYVVYINPNHPGNKGPKGASNVAHYELGRVQAEDRGIAGPGPTGSRDPAYFENANTKHAQETMRAHIRTDLRTPPPELPERPFTGSPRPTRQDEAGQMAAMAAQQTSMAVAVKKFGIRIGPKGYVSAYDVAEKAAKRQSEIMGERVIPVNIERLTRIPKEPVVPRSPERKIQLATAEERAWKQAVENRSPGKWALMPERVVQGFVDHAENSRKFGLPQKATNQFKDVVLTTGNPVRWLGGNVTDLSMRAAFEGLTPADLYRGARVYRELGKYGRRGQMTKTSTMGGGFGHLARDISHEVGTPATRLPGKAWDKWRAGVYGLESAIETLPQMATVGKEMRMGVMPSTQGLKGLLRATDEQVQHFTKTLVTDPAVELRVARHVEDVVGKWGKLSPEARRMLTVAPFAQWLGASTKYTLVTLPTKHPIKTALMSAIVEMTEEERKALGLSQYLPLEKQAQDYQMMTLPQSVTKDKYGPVVKGTDVARALSFGTVKEATEGNIGGFLFPQLNSAIAASIGASWTGERMVYPEGHPNAGMELSAADRRKAAFGMLIESFAPGASSFRRVVQEKGRPSLPQSTILDPQTRTKYDPKAKKWVPREGSTGEGVKRLTGWPIPGLPQPKRVYTKGAVHRISSNKTAIREVKRWNEQRKKPKGDWDFGGSAPEKTTKGDWDFR